MLLGYRSNDAVIGICQNNVVKSIEITDLNKIAQDALGFNEAEICGKPLTAILPERIGNLLKEYVEFENDANDVGNVLAKVQSFSVLDKAHKETGYRLKVVRTESNAGMTYFRLVLQDRMGLRKDEQLRKVIQDNFKGHEVLDEHTGLPDRYSLSKDIELMGYYNGKSDMRTCFAVIQVDHHQELMTQYGTPTSRALVNHIASLARQNLRPDDVVGSVGQARLGILLLDTAPESARMVFNRLRWQIAANPFHLPDRTSVGLSVSIGFSRISTGNGDRKIIDYCESALDSMGTTAVNVLVEVDETGKRMAG